MSDTRLLLDNDWQVQDRTEAQTDIPTLSGRIPLDIHQLLLDGGHNADPFYRRNEASVQWVHTRAWTLSTEFEVSAADLTHGATLQLDYLDTHATVLLNDTELGTVASSFRRHRFAVGSVLQPGANRLTILLHDNAELARQRADEQPFPVPWADMNNAIPHMNLVRKSQCDAGWDWGICLLSTGLYRAPELIFHRGRILDSVRVEQNHDLDNRQATLTVRVDTGGSADLPQTLNIALQEGTTATLELAAGVHSGEVRLQVDNPRLWWPAGHGEQPLYTLTVDLEGQTWERAIGLRDLRWDLSPDETGQSMTLRVNGEPIFARGANWIPADAFPARQTPERYTQLLQSAVDANMNMIRVWGGGIYEHDCFYELCEQMGLLVWQDLMFACALYPSTPEFLDDVTAEVGYQVGRLQAWGCIALWCGDNEVIGAIDWFDESRNNRDRYLVNYDRLNRTLAEVVAERDPQRLFWPSSPCNGELDYGDAWHDDSRGDMHFWDVWHEGRDFSAYTAIQPRFCSEFGYQSFPGLPLVEQFTAPEDRNVSSPVMETHQKNAGGNGRIVEMFMRYFRFPAGFEQFLYLSQVQQAVAMKTAIEYWRSLRPHCMGTLYWQLNDNWPVASWSSLDYSGGWKQLHYHARRFYQPVQLFWLQQDDALRLVAVNDLAEPAQLQGIWRRHGLDGEQHDRKTFNLELEAGASLELGRTRAENPEAEFVTVQASAVVGERHLLCDNTGYFARWKQLELPEPDVRMTLARNGENTLVTLDCSHPAHFVTLEARSPGRWSDNSLTLLPGEPRKLAWYGDGKPEVRLYHLRGSY